MLNQNDDADSDDANDEMELEDDAVPEKRNTVKSMVDTWMLKLLTNEEGSRSSFVDKTGIRRSPGLKLGKAS